MTIKNKILKSFILTISAAGLLLSSFQVTAQPPGPPGAGSRPLFVKADDPRVENRTYQFDDTNKNMPYSLFVSSKVSKDKQSPLIVTLHGLGTGPGIMMRGKALDLAEEGGYILVGPMGYNVGGWYGSPVINMKRDGAPPEPANLAELSEKDVINVLEMIRKEFNVDENRTYLMGHSMGGAGTLFLGSKHASNWAAIGAIAPAAFMMQPSDILEPVKNSMPVIITQGDADELVPAENTRRWVTYMKENNMNHKYVELSGAGHGDIIDLGMPDIFEFFANHSKAKHSK